MEFLPTEKYQFDEFQLDVPKRQLLRGGEVVELKPKAFDLLRVLVENSGKLLSKDDLFQMVWENQIVEESNLTVNMSQIRKALGEKASRPRYIATVSGQGYRFVGDVHELNDDGRDEFVIESQTIAHITIEDFEDEKGGQAPALPAGSNKKSKLLLIGAGLLLIILLGIGGYLWQFSRTKNPAAFRPVSMKRLTDIGNINNAAFSPDGTLYAYSIQEKDGRQSLWLGHVNGGENRQLRPPADVVFWGINFAPDGSGLYYNIVGDEFTSNQIFKMPVFGGASKKVYENVRSAISFAPDGKRFAFVRSNRENQKSSIIIAEIDGGTEREIVSRPLNLGFGLTTPAWSPDGKQIAAGAVTDEDGRTQKIYIIDAANGSIKSIDNFAWRSVRAIVWEQNTDGLFIVAGEKEGRWDAQIWHASLPEGEVRRVVSDLNVYGSCLGLSPNKNELLALQVQHYSNIWVAPAEKLSEAKQITHDLLGKKSGWDTLEWTPDGRIAFSAFTDAVETVWTMEADGKNQKQIIPAENTNGHFSFSDDGQKMVFESNRTGVWEIWTANSDGSNVRQLTFGGGNTEPNVSPDGNWVIYQSGRSGSDNLWRIPFGGGEPLKFNENTADWARFSPDGELIACLFVNDGKPRLNFLNAKSGQSEKSFDIPSSANFNNGIRWTPDGKAVTYRDWNNGIWQQDISGGEPRKISDLPEEKLYSYGWSRDGKLFAFTRGTEIRDLVLIQNTK